MREQDLSASPMPHSLGTFLAEQESTAPGRDANCRQKNCPGYSQDSVIGIIIGEAIASPQLSLYKRRNFVYNKASCNETYYR